MDEIEQQLKDHIAVLPRPIVDVLANPDLDQKIFGIAQKYNLHIDQAAQLENETFLVMLGAAPTDAYTENLMQHVRVTRDIAEALTRDVDALIFKPIRADLMSLTPEEGAPPHEDVPHDSASPPQGRTTPPPKNLIKDALETSHSSTQSDVHVAPPETKEGLVPLPSYEADPYREPVE